MPERLMRVYWASMSREDPAKATPAAVVAAVVRNRRREMPFAGSVSLSVRFMIWLLQNSKIARKEKASDRSRRLKNCGNKLTAAAFWMIEWR